MPLEQKEPTFSRVSAANAFGRRPYKFLDFYREEDAEYFFGRESEIEEICSKILSHRCFLLYGRSGVGKSSLTQAGLLPALKKQGYQVIVISNYQNPLQEIKNVLHPSLPAPGELKGERENELTAAKDQPMVICLFDQFEEFFAITPLEMKEEFKKELGKFIQSNRLTMRVVFTIREDFLAEMNFFKDLFPEIFSS